MKNSSAKFYDLDMMHQLLDTKGELKLWIWLAEFFIGPRYAAMLTGTLRDVVYVNGQSQPTIQDMDYCSLFRPAMRRGKEFLPISL